MPAIAYVNGDFLPLEQAVVSVEDRGFQLGDGVYEALRTYRGRPYAVAAHLRRLLVSLEAIELRHAFTAAALESILDEAVRRAGFKESLVYLQITRGTARRAKPFPSGADPTLVVTVRELDLSVAALRPAGVRMMTAPDLRWQRCDIKCIGLLPNVLACNRARASGFFEALFVQPDGTVAECSSSNLFIVQDGRVATPPAGPHVLAGITRETVLALARAGGVPALERPVTLDQLRGAEEVFLTGTTIEILPVVQVDAHPIGPGRPGPVTQTLGQMFQAAVGARSPGTAPA